jgi:hypothetical protein
MCAKCLKIPKRQSEAINRRRDYSMVKTKRTKRANSDPQNTTQKIKD